MFSLVFYFLIYFSNHTDTFASIFFFFQPILLIIKLSFLYDFLLQQFQLLRWLFNLGFNISIISSLFIFGGFLSLVDFGDLHPFFETLVMFVFLLFFWPDDFQRVFFLLRYIDWITFCNYSCFFWSFLMTWLFFWL